MVVVDTRRCRGGARLPLGDRYGDLGFRTRLPDRRGHGRDHRRLLQDSSRLSRCCLSAPATSHGSGPVLHEHGPHDKERMELAVDRDRLDPDRRWANTERSAGSDGSGIPSALVACGPCPMSLATTWASSTRPAGGPNLVDPEYPVRRRVDRQGRLRLPLEQALTYRMEQESIWWAPGAADLEKPLIIVDPVDHLDNRPPLEGGRNRR